MYLDLLLRFETARDIAPLVDRARAEGIALDIAPRGPGDCRVRVHGSYPDGFDVQAFLAPVTGLYTEVSRTVIP